MNQSRTKSKVLLIASLAIVFVCAMLIVSIVEIRKYHLCKQEIASQEQLLEELQNKKDYYNSKNHDNNTARDNGYAGEDDLIFGEE